MSLPEANTHTQTQPAHKYIHGIVFRGGVGRAQDAFEADDGVAAVIKAAHVLQLVSRQIRNGAALKKVAREKKKTKQTKKTKKTKTKKQK